MSQTVKNTYTSLSVSWTRDSYFSSRSFWSSLRLSVSYLPVLVKCWDQVLELLGQKRSAVFHLPFSILDLINNSVSTKMGDHIIIFLGAAEQEGGNKGKFGRLVDSRGLSLLMTKQKLFPLDWSQFFFFFLNVYSFLRQSVSEGEAGRGGTEDLKWGLRWQQWAWCGARTQELSCEIMTWAFAVAVATTWGSRHIDGTSV